jgi:hypothetical protein
MAYCPPPPSFNQAPRRSPSTAASSHNLLPPPDAVTHPTISARIDHAPVHELELPPTYPTNIQIHLDGGAICSVTNNHKLLQRFRNIKTFSIAGVAADTVAIQCTGQGFFPWQSTTSHTLLVNCYYSPQAADTIISPTNVVITHKLTTMPGNNIPTLTLVRVILDSIPDPPPP